MPPSGTPDDLAPSIRRLIAAKASRLVGSYGLRPQDRPDVEQELAARVIDRLADHDPGRSAPEAFAAVIVDQAVANLLRDRRARKRTPPRQSGPPTPPEDAPDQRAEDDARRRELANDVAAVLSRLSAELRPLAERLKSGTVSEVARSIGVPRTSLYGPVAELRAIFDRAGLRDYV